jgi:gliding motility-associated-like protein
MWIKRILVDACVPGGGCTNSLSPACSCEGKNEMVLFRVGNQPISISNITFNWPNNSFKGIVFPNALTASITASLQSSIQGCGALLEPTTGVLPANTDVLFILSTDMCVSANSFANLQDTIYVIYQNAGNFQGHFANANSTSSLTPRITSFTVTGSPSCTGSVSYIPAYLTSTAGVSYSVNQNYSSSLYDGGAVEYDAAGTPTYVNIGCNAPFTPMQVTVQLTQQSVCASSAVQMTAGVLNGYYSNLFWTGGQGSFAVNNTTQTTNVYTPAPGESGIVTLTCIATRTCGSITGSAQAVFTINVLVQPTITLPNSYTICSGQTLVLSPTISPVSLTGPQSYSWNTGATTSTLSVTSPGTYSFYVQGSCAGNSASVQVYQVPDVSVQIQAPAPPYCQQTTLTASGNGTSYVWNGSIPSPTLLVQQSGIYTVQTAGPCNTAINTLSVSILPSPSIQVVPASTVFCNPSSSITFTALANGTVIWNGSVPGFTFAASSPGTFTAQTSNACGTASAGGVLSYSTVVSSFSANPSTGNAPLTVNFHNTSSGATSYTWNFGNGAYAYIANPTQVFNSSGEYEVVLISSNGLCSDTSRVTIKVENEFGPIPELVTPNGDGKNDTWEIRGLLQYKNAEVEIYNRWGNLVYSKAPYKNEWNGISEKGGRLPVGYYYYILKLNDKENRIFKGYIRLEY